MGGPDMAPQTPQRSARPGAAVTRLDHALLDGPRKGPQTPERPKRPGTAVPLLCQRAFQLNMGAPTWPPNPQTFEAARHSRAASLSARISVDHGGPDMAPQPPQRSARPGAAVTRLDHALLDGPRHGPQTPKRSKRRGTAVPLLCQRAFQLTMGAPTWPPNPPNARHVPAQP